MTLRTNLLHLVLILGIFSCFHFSTAHRGCEELKGAFSNTTQSFFACAINGAEPVRYCRRCGQEFVKVTATYNALFAHVTCQAKYFNQDRISILEMVYANAQLVWNAGSCSSCYDWVDGDHPQTLSNATKDFFDEMEVFDFCLDQYTNETACTICLDSYNNVNDIYKSIQMATINDKFCFDIKDAMNKTRLNWSHNLKCCKDRKTSLTTFYVTSGIISVLIPFVFYTSFMFFGWRRDQLQQPLTDSDIHSSEERTQEVEAIGPSTVPAISNLLEL